MVRKPNLILYFLEAAVVGSSGSRIVSRQVKIVLLHARQDTYVRKGLACAMIIRKQLNEVLPKTARAVNRFPASWDSLGRLVPTANITTNALSVATSGVTGAGAASRRFWSCSRSFGWAEWCLQVGWRQRPSLNALHTKAHKCDSSLMRRTVYAHVCVKAQILTILITFNSLYIFSQLRGDHLGCCVRKWRAAVGWTRHGEAVPKA